MTRIKSKDKFGFELKIINEFIIPILVLCQMSVNVGEMRESRIANTEWFKESNRQLVAAIKDLQ